MSKQKTAMSSGRSSSQSAKRSKISVVNRAHAWLYHHKSVWKDTLARFLEKPFGYVLTSCVIAIALSLPMMLWLFADSVRVASALVDTSAKISIYAKPAASDSEIKQLKQEILSRSELELIRYVSPEQGLEQFQTHSGIAELAVGLDSNPLPGLFLVRPLFDMTDPTQDATTTELLQTLKSSQHVDQVIVDFAWLDRVASAAEFMERIGIALTLLLGVGVVLILGNSIRLEIENRREEIVVIKLVGGTDAYVRRPLLYSGLLYGLLGGALAWGLSFSCMLFMRIPMTDMALSYGSQFRLSLPLLVEGLLLLLSGALLGILGAWLSVARHLVSIQPR